MSDGDKYTMDEFRAEMAARGVYDNAKQREAGRRFREKRKKLKIATGAPKFGESKLDRDVRLAASSTSAFYGDIVQSAKARLDLLAGAQGRSERPCPWLNLGPHTSSCRCAGSGRVTVSQLRAHYAAMIELYRGLA